MIFLVILGIAVFSVGLSFLSLRNLKKMGEMQHAKDDLKRHRVIYQKDSSLPPSA
ncbi:MAG: hypothetical protein RLZZ455_1168 [Candidatus Parcubacteria bacterium]|jgi:hypothetical protein